MSVPVDHDPNSSTLHKADLFSDPAHQRFGSNGVHANGALPDGALPDGALLDGALPNGTLPNGTLSNGTLSNGAHAEGASLASRPGLIPVADWNLLFNAVQARLRAAIDTLHSAGATDAGPVKTTLLECAGELTRLHAALNHERQARA